MIQLEEIEAFIRSVEEEPYRQCIGNNTHVFGKSSHMWTDKRSGEILAQCTVCHCMVSVDERKK